MRLKELPKYKQDIERAKRGDLDMFAIVFGILFMTPLSLLVGVIIYRIVGIFW